MRLSLTLKSTLFTFFLTLNTVYATPITPPQWLVMPQCLSEKIAPDFPVVISEADLALHEVPFDAIEGVAKLADTVDCGRFINITPQCHHDLHCARAWLSPKGYFPRTTAKAYHMHHSDEVIQTIQAVDTAQLVNTIGFLSRYKNRAANRLSGVRTAAWLKEQFDKLADTAGRTDVTSFYVETGDLYAQPSVVGVLGTEKHDGPGIVLGAHMDTLNGIMPGADDDGSGTASVLEAARILMHTPGLKRPIYFIWYAAEERGLVGSQFVVDYFKQHDIPIEAVIQLDMTGYQADPSDPTLWFYRDNTSPHLTEFMQQLTQSYLHLPVGDTACGYGCSDHVIWSNAGFNTVFPGESDFEHHNPSIHTRNDTLALINLSHMTHFVQLALAFIVEVGLTRVC